MSVINKVNAVTRLLERINDYERIILADGFEAATVVDMKSNAKDLCDAAKAEIDNIKTEIDSWG